MDCESIFRKDLICLPKDFLNKVISRHLGIQERVSSFKLIRYESSITVPWVDVTKAKLAYGRWAIPKLEKDLTSTREINLIQALNTLLDLLHDTEKACEAIRLNITRRLARLIMFKLPFIRQITLACLSVIAHQPGGKFSIIKNQLAIKNLKKALHDENQGVRHGAVITLQALASNWIGVYPLVQQGFIPLVLQCLLKYNNLPKLNVELLKLLEALLDLDDNAKAQAIANDACKLTGMFQRNSQVDVAVASVMMQLFKNPIGKKAFLYHDMDGYFLTRIGAEDSEVRAEICKALVFATITPEGRKVVLENDANLIETLTEYAHFYNAPELKINAIKLLTNLAEIPSIRKKLKDSLNIFSMSCLDKNVYIKEHAKILCDTIKMEP